MSDGGVAMCDPLNPDTYIVSGNWAGHRAVLCEANTIELLADSGFICLDTEAFGPRVFVATGSRNG